MEQFCSPPVRARGNVGELSLHSSPSQLIAPSLSLVRNFSLLLRSLSTVAVWQYIASSAAACNEPCRGSGCQGRQQVRGGAAAAASTSIFLSAARADILFRRSREGERERERAMVD